MQVYSCDQFELPLPSGHRFPMAKYRLLRERVALQASRLGAILVEPPRADDLMLNRAHSPTYVQAVCAGTLDPSEIRRIGFPWSTDMVERSRRSSGATSAALIDALRDGVAVNLAGGTHHASYARGGGYCVFNDSVVAARHAQAIAGIGTVLVIDLDVHQGNGTAEICAQDPRIFTFSVHAARNYPAVKAISDLDVALPDGTTDGPYLDALRAGLAQALERSRPDAAIYLAGADPFEGDRLGYLSLSKPGLAARDAHVLQTLAAAGIPVAISMAGGYAQRVEDIVDIHFATVEAASLAIRSWA